MSYKIGIFGSGINESDDYIQKAIKLGEELGKHQATVITGACSGMPYQVAQTAKQNGAKVWGFSRAKNLSDQKQFTPDDDLSIYDKLIYPPAEISQKYDMPARGKYRNVTSTEMCNAGIIIAGRWGTLNEFTNLIDMGKVIGILTGTGGIADELECLTQKINKQTNACLIFDSSPERLVEKIFQKLDNSQSITHKPMDKQNLILKLYEIGAIKFGEFKLKTGSLSPIYIDLRLIVSYPELLQNIADIMWEKVQYLNFDLICGVPYTALPIATAMSLKQNKPMVMRRKEVKDYGTKKAIEGVFEQDQNCLIIEDLVTSGSSVFETIEPLEHAGMKVTDIVVLLDREQSGKENINNRGYNLHSIINMTELLNTLRDNYKIDDVMYNKVVNYLRANQVKTDNINMNIPITASNLSYTDRAELCANSTAKKLLQLMGSKQTNLTVAADVSTKAELLKLASDLGPEICILKTHIDIIEDFDQDLVRELRRLANFHNFLIFEDRKFADIGNTVKIQYEKGIYHIADWADIVNAHSVAGPGIILGLKEGGQPKGRGLLMLAEMSSKGTLAQGSYTEETLKMAQEHSDFVIGFITMKKQLDDPRFINLTPGVKLFAEAGALMQQYDTPEKIIYEQGSDVIIVGSGIYKSSDPLGEAKKYREAGWRAYQKRLL